MRRPRWARLTRFGAVGLLGAGCQVLLLTLLVKGAHLPAVVATPISVEFTLLHNFVWHERFTWSDRAACTLSERTMRLWRFHAGNGAVSLLGNTALMYWLVERLKLPLTLSAVGVIAICAMANFVLADRWVYVLARPASRKARPWERR